MQEARARSRELEERCRDVEDRSAVAVAELRAALAGEERERAVLAAALARSEAAEQGALAGAREQSLALDVARAAHEQAVLLPTPRYASLSCRSSCVAA